MVSLFIYKGGGNGGVGVIGGLQLEGFWRAGRQLEWFWVAGRQSDFGGRGVIDPI